MKNDNSLEILFENEDFLVINKPSGITVNRADTTRGEETLQDIIDKKFARGSATRSAPERARRRLTRLRAVGSPSTPVAPRSPFDTFDTSDTPDTSFYDRSGIVHRLDKETSGLLIIAKNPKSFESLQLQFKNRKVEKTYIALVHGQIIPSAGEISAPVGRLPWNRKRFGVLAGGREAVTHYETISNIQYPIFNEILTLVRLFPKTGRTHQIRVHLKYIGHPIFGDPLYGGRKTAREDRVILPRVFLHAEELSFYDPRTEEKKTFRAELPEELKKLVDGLRKS